MADAPVPAAMAAWLDSDAAPLSAFALLVAETAGLLWWRRRTGRGVSADRALTFAASGAALLLALVFHRRPGGAGAFALAMLAALGFHAWHLARLARPS